MQNHFVFSYTGNKRTEVKTIEAAINTKGMTTICEPFCGSSAVSFYLSTQHPKRFKYILNDLDANLMKMYEAMKDSEKWRKMQIGYEFMTTLVRRQPTVEAKKKIYKEVINAPGIIGYITANRFKQLRTGIYPLI